MSEPREKQPTLDEAALRRWIGNTRSQEDRIDCLRANLLGATLDPDREELVAGDFLPSGWHWIYFLDAAPLNRLGRDGHAPLGEFLPPVALPKRMWAGSRLKFHRPILLDEPIRRDSEVIAVNRKSGRSGELCFVTVSHKYFSGTELKLDEEHDIVYREEQTSDSSHSARQAAPNSDRSLLVVPTTTLLFRYSALTFNGHRIHYDLEFAEDVEGYPGLVVHAPLVATLMLGLAEKYYAGRNLRPQEFRQRSMSPLFHRQPFTIGLTENDRGCDMQAADHDGLLASSASLVMTSSNS